MLHLSNHTSSVSCSVDLPLSKSIVNRLLLIHHISGGEKINALISDSSDTVAMQELLQKISNTSPNSEKFTEINVGNAGTVMRFLTALLTITPGNWIITGIERMQQRPVKPLTDALLQLGADLSFAGREGFPPVVIRGNAGLQGGVVKLNAGISSQFISALMMLGPALNGGIEIELEGEVISASYIRMTSALMERAGAETTFAGNRILIAAKGYHKFDFAQLAEPDWSAAAFWYQVAAFAISTRIVLKGLSNKSVQGDSVLPAIYEKLGITSTFTQEGVILTHSDHPPLSEFNYDFTECPDLAQAVIVTCAAKGIKGRFSGLKTLRVKETDRIEALKNELTKLGYPVQVIDDQIVLEGKTDLIKTSDPVFIHCYDDHRMAMAFATLALLRNDIVIDEPHVVRKSYPGFWNDLALAGFVYAEME